MVTAREQRLLAIVRRLRERDSSAMVELALDRLEAQIRTKDASGHEHVGKGSPQGGQFGSGGGGGSSTVAQHGRAKRKPRPKRVPGATRPEQHKLTASEKADRIRKGKVPQSEMSEKALRAQKNQSKTTGDVQQYTKKNEYKLAERLGGKAYPDNDPIDVSTKIGGKEHGIEVKTLTHGKNDKLTMKGSALQRKFDWEVENKAKMHTVALDHRDQFGGGKNSALYSGNEIYYKRGVGSFRIGTMHKVKDAAELKKLMAMPFDKLPKAAQGEIRPHEVKHKIKS